MNRSELAKKIPVEVLSRAKPIFGDALHSVILYGSYARGDYDDESDIDLMLLLKMDRLEAKRFRKEMVHVASELSLEHDVDVSTIMVPVNEFEKWKDDLPFYRNVATEGVSYVA